MSFSGFYAPADQAKEVVMRLIDIHVAAIRSPSADDRVWISIRDILTPEKEAEVRALLRDEFAIEMSHA